MKPVLSFTVLLGLISCNGHRNPVPPPVTPPVAPAAPAPPELREYLAEKTIGDTRMVLLRISRSTVFDSAGVRSPEPAKPYAVPEVVVEYLVEYVGEAPRGVPAHGAVALLAGGKPVEPIEAVIDGGESSSNPWPQAAGPAAKVTDPKNVIVHRHTLRGIVPSTRTVDLRITAGFGPNPAEFTFKDIPLY